MELRDYQEEAVNAINEEIIQDDKCFVEIFYGTGK